MHSLCLTLVNIVHMDGIEFTDGLVHVFVSTVTSTCQYCHQLKLQSGEDYKTVLCVILSCA